MRLFYLKAEGEARFGGMNKCARVVGARFGCDLARSGKVANKCSTNTFMLVPKN